MMNNVNLISISGRMSSGKDTVGKIIQYLIFQKKFDSSEGFRQDAHISYDLCGWEIKKFAGKLKQIASILTGIPVEKFEDQEFKKEFLGEEWDYYEDGVSNDMIVRTFLQKLGTEALRNGLHENVWCNALFSDYQYIGYDENTVKTLLSKNWIITDTRFPNEFQAVKDKKGICVKVYRSASLRGVDSNHLSERALDNHTFDYEIDNNSDIFTLVEKVKEMLVYFKIL